MTIFRPGIHNIMVPDFGVSISAPAQAAAATGWWNAGGCPDSAWADVWTFKSAADYATAKVGNVNATVLAEGNGAVPWDAVNGMKFTAASAQWLDTGIVPTSTYGMIIQFSDSSGENIEDLAGILDSTFARFYLRSRHSTDVHIYGFGNSAQLVAPRLADGNMALTGGYGWLNGVSEVALGSWRNTLVTIPIGRSRPTYEYYCTANILAIGIANTDISAYVAALSAAMGSLA